MSDNEYKSKSFVERFFSEKLSLFLSIISFCCIIVAAIIFIVFGSWHFSSTLDEAKVGQFGDFIGGVFGTLLAFVAAILYYIALREQRRDIAINQESARLQNETLIKQIEEFEKQKEELELTRQVYEQQSKTMAAQERTMKIQQFESNFYSLLNVCISIKNELNKNCNKKDYFKEKYDELYSFAKDQLYNENQPIKCHKIVVSSYTNLFLIYKGELSHYFKSLYRLIKIVDSNITLSDSEKIFYTKIIRSQITEYELLLMNYNYHSIYASKARNLIYKYNILKHTYPLSKIEIQNKYNIPDKQPMLISFFDLLSSMLEENINLICDSIDIQDQEKRFNLFNCIIRVSYNEDVRVSISCLDESKLPLNFENIVYDYLYDKLYISQFRMVDDGIDYQKNNSDGILYLHYILNERLIGKINIDKN